MQRYLTTNIITKHREATGWAAPSPGQLYPSPSSAHAGHLPAFLLLQPATSDHPASAPSPGAARSKYRPDCQLQSLTELVPSSWPGPHPQAVPVPMLRPARLPHSALAWAMDSSHCSCGSQTSRSTRDPRMWERRCPRQTSVGSGGVQRAPPGQRGEAGDLSALSVSEEGCAFCCSQCDSHQPHQGL